MVVVDKLTVEVEADIKKFDANMDTSKRKMQTFSKTTEKEAKNIKKSAEKVNGAFSGLKGIIAGALSIGAVVGFGKKLFQLGSDLEETQSKFNTVFSGIEKETQDKFNQIADNVGRSRLEMIEFGASVGDILNPLGFLKEDSAALSAEITKLAIDVASFNNAQDADVIHAFKAALTGEREALKSLGIVINEADIKNKALTEGYIKQGEELTKQQKALVTWQLLLDNTADAQGDAIRTSKSFANQLKKLGGVIKDTFAEAGKEVAQDTAGFLADIALFVQQYGVAFIKTFVEIAKTIGGVFATAFEGIAVIFDGIGSLIGQNTKDTMTWGDRFIWVLNRINFGIKTLLFIFKSLGKGIGAVMAAVVLTAKDSGILLIDVFKLAVTAIGEAFTYLPNKLSGALGKALNAGAAKLNGFLDKINAVFGTDYKINVSFDEGTGGGFAGTSELFASIEARRKKIGATIAGIGQDLNAEIKQDTLNLAAEMDAVNKKTTGAVKSSEQAKQDAYDATFKKFQEWNEKYKDGTIDANSTAKKEADKTAKALEQAVKDQVKELEDLKEEGMKTYTDINEDIDGQREKILKLVDEYKDLEAKIEEVGENGAADIQKITDAMAELDEKLAGITTEGNLELAQRELDIKERLKEIEEDRKDINKDGLQEGEYEKLKKLKQEQKDLEEELLVLAENLTEEDRLKATAELQKSKTQLILDGIEAKKQEVEDERAALEEKKAAREAELAAELEKLETLKEAKKNEALAEGDTLKALIDTKNKLENSYLKAFGERVEIEKKKVESLTAKYKALAAAKREAGYSGTVLGTAATLANQAKSEFDTRKTSEVKTSNINIYGDITNNNQGDLENFTNELNSQINP